MTTTTAAPAAPVPGPLPDPQSTLAEWDVDDRAVLRLIPRGYTNREIAEEVNLSEDRVKLSVRRIRGRLGIEASRQSNRERIAVAAVRDGLVPYTDIPFLATASLTGVLSHQRNQIVGRVIAGQSNVAIAADLTLTENVVREELKVVRDVYGIPGGDGLRVRIAVTATYLHHLARVAAQQGRQQARS